MGLGDSDILARADDGTGKLLAAEVSCSICLEAVTDNGDRSWSKLQCGHKFHLDCIGSAFNIKGAMQCPNCRKIEKGKWRYANYRRQLPHYTMVDWSYDNDRYDLRSEMSFAVRWTHDGSASPIPFDESVIIFPPYRAMSSATHNPCPSYFVFNLGPVQQSSSASSGGSISDLSNLNNNNNNNNHSWIGPNDAVPSSYAFPQYGDQPSFQAVTRGVNRNNSDMTRRHWMRQFVVGHGSATRPPSYAASSVLPPYPGHVSQHRDHRPSFPANFQQSNSITSNGRRIFQETEIPVQEQHFGVWEREHQPPFQSNHISQDSIWGQPVGGFDTGIRSNGFRHRPQNWS